MRDNPIRITPLEGHVYHNAGGGDYRVLSLTAGCYKVQNIRSGWTCWAHGCTQYSDGSIEWDYSTGGVFVDLH